MRKLLFITALVICKISVSYAMEFHDMADYLEVYPNGKHDGSDGNWLKIDRKNRNAIWRTANETNLKKDDGFKQYQTVIERSEFYRWIQYTTDSLGFETKWPGVGAETTWKLNKLLTDIACIMGNSNKEIKKFIVDGNEKIFHDIWPLLQGIRTSRPLKGMDAKAWDVELLYKEQHLLQLSYDQISAHALNILHKSIRKEGIFTKFLPGFEFVGDLNNLRDRWNYGMKMMGYQP